MPLPDVEFWSGKRVLLTGHTGFKGAWTALWLRRMGAEVTGLALPPEPLSLYELANVQSRVASHFVDLRDIAAVARVVQDCRPDVVIHMAAQALVSRGYAAPTETFAVNLMGTVHLLDALRDVPPPAAVLIVTTDKVYANDESGRAWREADRLGGKDPYSASKAACEIATACMAHSYLAPGGTLVATARGGNVIGGGDFSADRLVPDVIRAALRGEALTLRNPHATRPWQHVLDCVAGYLTYAAGLAGGCTLPPALNFGPERRDIVSVGALAEAMLKALGINTQWHHVERPALRESHALTIDSRLARRALGWGNRLTGRQLINTTAGWYRAWTQQQDMRAFTLQQIAEYEALP